MRERIGANTSFVSTIVYSIAYAAVILVLALVGREVFGPTVYLVLLVAALSAGASVFFAANTGYFQREAVDFFYYSLLLVGGIVLFANEYPQRVERNELQKLRPFAEAHAQARTQLIDFESLVTRSSAIKEAFFTDTLGNLAKIRRVEVDAVIRLNDYGTASCAQSFGFDLPVSLEPKDDDDIMNLVEQAEIAAARAQCEKEIEQLRQKKKQEMMASQIDLATFKTNADRFTPIFQKTIWIGNDEISIGQLHLLLTQLTDEQAIEVEREKFKQAQKKADADLRTAKKKAEQQIEIAKFGVPPFVGSVSFEIWPYVLILLLSLKLSRPR